MANLDLTKNAVENMLNIFNTTNIPDETDYLTKYDITFTNPVALPPVYLPKSDPNDPEEPLIVDRTVSNTSVTATGIGNYTGTASLTYKRLDLDYEVQYLHYNAADYADWDDFVSKFGVQNTVLTSELVFTPADFGTSGVNQITITPVAGSLIYFGSKVIRMTVA